MPDFNDPEDPSVVYLEVYERVQFEDREVDVVGYRERFREFHALAIPLGEHLT